MNPSTAQARVIVDELIRHDVRDAVLCPGSRSAPLALALAAAERAGRVRLHVRIDERTAGYLALGLAMGSGRPVPVLVTSGTAVANLHPAMVEAAMSGVPIIAFTANRPPELRGVGANQTIDQVGLFGPHSREVVELGVAVDPAAEHVHWRTGVGRAVLSAGSPVDPGPVQMDVAFREPLVPEEGDENDGEIPEALAGRPDGRPWIHRSGAGAGLIEHSSACAIDLTKRTVVVAGAGAPPVAELIGVPAVAEPGAPVPLHRVHPLVLDSLDVEQVVVVGRPTLHRSVTRLLSSPDVNVVVLSGGPRWANPTGAAAEIGDSVLTGWAPAPEWVSTVRRVDESARAVIGTRLANGECTGLHVARVVCASLRGGDHLVCGSSNSIRDVALVGDLSPDVTVHANRGASGIDGTVSTAIGVAGVVPGRTVALMGDLTFLHDAGGLLLGPAEHRPTDATIVVADDDGGGIFSLLEQGDPRHAADFERVFGTPHGVDLGTICRGYGIDFVDVGDDLDELTRLLGSEEPAGIRVLRVATVRAELRDLHSEIAREVRAAADTQVATDGQRGAADSGGELGTRRAAAT